MRFDMDDEEYNEYLERQAEEDERAHIEAENAAAQAQAEAEIEEISEQIIPKELKQLRAIVKEYKRKALGFDDFVAGIQGRSLSKTGFMIPAERGIPRRLDISKLILSLNKGGFKNLKSLWESEKIRE